MTRLILVALAGYVLGRVQLYRVLAACECAMREAVSYRDRCALLDFERRMAYGRPDIIVIAVRRRT